MTPQNFFKKKKSCLNDIQTKNSRELKTKKEKKKPDQEALQQP